MLGRVLSLVAALLLSCASTGAHAYARPLHSENARQGFAATEHDAHREQARVTARAASENSPAITEASDGRRFYAKARYYSAGRGSFLSTDPWSGDQTNPLSYNKYLYAYASPGSYVDPDGRMSMSPDAAMGYVRTLLPPDKQAEWDRKSKAYLEQISAEQAGSTAGAVEWASENVEATVAFGRDALAAGVEQKLPGVVDFGGRRAMEQRGEALGSFLANDPIGAIRSETSRIQTEAATLRERGRFGEAATLTTKLGLDYLSAGAGAYGVVRAGVSRVQKLGRRPPELSESAPSRIVEDDSGGVTAEVAQGPQSIAEVSNARLSTTGTTRRGVHRRNPSEWRALRDSWDDLGYGSALSEGNRALIARGRTPAVDDAWIDVFPEDAGLLGEQIRMHHVAGYPVTVPLAETRHLDAHMPGGFRFNEGGPGAQAPFYLRREPQFSADGSEE